MFFIFKKVVFFRIPLPHDISGYGITLRDSNTTITSEVCTAVGLGLLIVGN